VAPRGKAVGADIDQTKLDLARQEAQQQGIGNVEFRLSDVGEEAGASEFDIVYARFLLTHLGDPASAVSAFYRHVRPGGFVAVEDVDFRGCVAYPESKAQARFRDLYCTVVRRRGGDPNIGPRLPVLLKTAGLEDVGVHVVQPMGMEGEVKFIDSLTMENIAEAVLQEGLAARDEIDVIVRQLYEFGADPDTVVGLPRVVQSWGRRPKNATPS